MRSSNRRPLVAVIGASDVDRAVHLQAEEVGRAIAGRGWNLLTGGGQGVMAAACFGFQKAKVIEAQNTIGILPSEDDGFANDHVDIAIPTGMGPARNAIIARAANGLIAVGGLSGTLSEIALAWQLGKPLIALKSSGGWASKLAGQQIDDRRGDKVFAASNAVEAVSILEEFFSHR